MQSVIIDGVDLYEEYGFITASVSVQEPDVQTKFIEVPMRDGSIDCSNVLSDIVRYKDRTIEINLFRMVADESILSMLSSFLHGQKKNITFGNDEGYYYVGRIAVSNVVRTKGTMTVTLTAICEPFKYDVALSDVDWEWDTFDLQNGIVNELGGLEVKGTATFTLICRRDREFPLFTVSEPMELVFKDKTYLIKAGTNKLYNVFFDSGENELTFNGYGTVSISYRGGNL